MRSRNSLDHIPKDSGKERTQKKSKPLLDRNIQLLMSTHVVFVGFFFYWVVLYCLRVYVSRLFVGGGSTQGAGVVIQGGDALMGAGGL